MGDRARGQIRQSKKSRQRLKDAEDTERALDLVRAGMSIRQIASTMGRSVGNAHKLIKRGRESIPAETRDRLVAEICERERGIILAHWPNRKDHNSAGVIQRSDKMLIDLFGLEAPKRTEHTGKDGGPIVFDLSSLTDEQLERLLTGDTSVLPARSSASVEDAGRGGEEAEDD